MFPVVPVSGRASGTRMGSFPTSSLLLYTKPVSSGAHVSGKCPNPGVHIVRTHGILHSGECTRGCTHGPFSTGGCGTQLIPSFTLRSVPGVSSLRVILPHPLSLSDSSGPFRNVTVSPGFGVGLLETGVLWTLLGGLTVFVLVPETDGVSLPPPLERAVRRSDDLP